MMMIIEQNGAIIIEGHIQGLSNTRSLGEIGIPVFVIDKTDCIARHSKFCTKFFQCPEFITDEFYLFLIELAKTEDIHNWVLLPSNDHAVITISKHRKQLQKYYRVITPDLDILNNIYDKPRLLNIAKQVGVPIPESFHFESADDKLPHNLIFPVITKGRFGLSFYKAIGKKAFVAENEEILRTNLNTIIEKYSIRDTFTQKLISYDGTNKTISFTAFCVSGKIETYWMGVKLREHPIHFGTATFAKSVFIEDCLFQSRQLLNALNYTGVCEVEYLYDSTSKKYNLIEINARTWLWVGLAKACGVDYAKIIFKHFNNGSQSFPSSYKLGIYWINPISDTFFSIMAIFGNKLHVFEYFNSILQKNKINALFQKNDLKPGFRYLIKLLSFINNR